jgi:hypothetical protein
MQVMEAIAVGVTVADARRPDSPLIYVNPAFLAMTGYAADEVLGRNCHFLQAHDTHQPAIGTLRAALREGREVSVLLRNYRKDGTLFWNRLSLAPVRDQHGQITHFVGIQQDVTKELRAQEELCQAKEEAERAIQAKSEFLSQMSHELRTPMNAVLGFAQLLEYDPRLDALQRESVQEILRGGRQLLKHINEILDLSRLKSGQIQFALEPVVLESLVLDCLALVEPLARVRGVTLRTGAMQEYVVWADRGLLKQVIVNLLTNAILYNGSQGLVSLDASIIPGHLTQDHPRTLRLQVSDTGPGISPAHMTEIFQPFMRLNADDPHIEGSGIGLAACDQLAEAMGGRIGVESVLGAGSRFWIELPALESMPPDASDR